MATIKKFLFMDENGQLAEQTESISIQVNDGVAARDAVNKGQLDGAVDALETLITAEETRALAAEALLGDAITTETAARAADVATLNAAIEAEETRATAAEVALGGRIDTEIADRQAAITSEATTRAAADAALRADLDQEILDRAAAVTAEETARLAADADLQSQIDALETASNTALTTAINTLTTNLAAEEAARIAADAALQTELDAEEARAAAAEAAIAADLAAEETRALAAEADLAQDIADEQSRAQAAESTLTSNLAAESARAIAREDEIDAALDAEIARATAAEAANLQEAKDYADARVQGLSFKTSVDYAFDRVQGALTLPADGAAFSAAQSLAEGTRVLLFGGSHVDNGIYVVGADGSFARAADMAATKDAAGAYVYVENTSEAGAAPGTSFVCSNAGTAAVGSAALEFVIFSRAENLSFSSGVQKIGTAVSLKVEAAKPVYVNGSNELTFRIGGDDLGIDGSGFLSVVGDLVNGELSYADGKHSHKSIGYEVASAATVGSFVNVAGEAVTYNDQFVSGGVSFASGGNARVVTSGICPVASGALNAFADGEWAFVGASAGVFCKFADVPSQKWAHPVGYRKSATELVVMPRASTFKA